MTWDQTISTLILAEYPQFFICTFDSQANLPFMNICCCLVAKLCPALLQPRGLQCARLHCPWDFPDKNTGVHCLFLFQGLFWAQGATPYLLHWQVDSLQLSHQGSPLEYYTDERAEVIKSQNVQTIYKGKKSKWFLLIFRNSLLLTIFSALLSDQS